MDSDATASFKTAPPAEHTPKPFTAPFAIGFLEILPRMDVYREFKRRLWGGPGIASQATHLEFACYLGFGQSSTFRWHKNLIPNVTGQPPAPGDGVYSRFWRGGKTLGSRCARLSCCLLIGFINTPILLLLPELRGVYQFAFPFFLSLFFFFFWVRRSLCPLRSRSLTRAPRAQIIRYLRQRTTKDWECSVKI